MSNSKPTDKHNYTISRKQLEMLVSKAGQDAVDAALIQNGSQPTEFTVSKRQLEKLIQKAGPNAVEAALIQNGSSPDSFTGGGGSN